MSAKLSVDILHNMHWLVEEHRALLLVLVSPASPSQTLSGKCGCFTKGRLDCGIVPERRRPNNPKSG